jgi:hypothetical protein
MKVKIFKPAKSAMQSGKKNSKKWLMLPFEEINTRSISKLTGWTSSNDTSTQLKFEFSSKEDAINFAKDRNFTYEIEEPKIATLKKKSYAENFTN